MKGIIYFLSCFSYGEKNIMLSQEQRDIALKFWKQYRTETSFIL